MVNITQLSQLNLNKNYSYVDYLSWQLDEAVELIKDKIMLMSPAPNTQHQRVSWQLSSFLYQYFKQKPCKAFAAPFDVSLYNRKKSLRQNKEIHSVVQADLEIDLDEVFNA